MLVLVLFLQSVISTAPKFCSPKDPEYKDRFQNSSSTYISPNVCSDINAACLQQLPPKAVTAFNETCWNQIPCEELAQEESMKKFNTIPEKTLETKNIKAYTRCCLPANGSKNLTFLLKLLSIKITRKMLDDVDQSCFFTESSFRLLENAKALELLKEGKNAKMCAFVDFTKFLPKDIGDASVNCLGELSYSKAAVLDATQFKDLHKDDPQRIKKLIGVKDGYKSLCSKLPKVKDLKDEIIPLIGSDYSCAGALEANQIIGAPAATLKAIFDQAKGFALKLLMNRLSAGADLDAVVDAFSDLSGYSKEAVGVLNAVFLNSVLTRNPKNMPNLNHIADKEKSVLEHVTDITKLERRVFFDGNGVCSALIGEALIISKKAIDSKRTEQLIEYLDGDLCACLPVVSKVIDNIETSSSQANCYAKLTKQQIQKKADWDALISKNACSHLRVAIALDTWQTSCIDQLHSDYVNALTPSDIKAILIHDPNNFEKLLSKADAKVVASKLPSLATASLEAKFKLLGDLPFDKAFIEKMTSAQIPLEKPADPSLLNRIISSWAQTRFSSIANLPIDGHVGAACKYITVFDDKSAFPSSNFTEFTAGCLDHVGTITRQKDFESIKADLFKDVSQADSASLMTKSQLCFFATGQEDCKGACRKVTLAIDSINQNILKDLGDLLVSACAVHFDALKDEKKLALVALLPIQVFEASKPRQLLSVVVKAQPKFCSKVTLEHVKALVAKSKNCAMLTLECIKACLEESPDCPFASELTGKCLDKIIDAKTVDAAVTALSVTAFEKINGAAFKGSKLDWKPKLCTRQKEELAKAISKTLVRDVADLEAKLAKNVHVSASDCKDILKDLKDAKVFKIKFGKESLDLFKQIVPEAFAHLDETAVISLAAFNQISEQQAQHLPLNGKFCERFKVNQVIESKAQSTVEAKCKGLETATEKQVRAGKVAALKAKMLIGAVKADANRELIGDLSCDALSLDFDGSFELIQSVDAKCFSQLKAGQLGLKERDLLARLSKEQCDELLKNSSLFFCFRLDQGDSVQDPLGKSAIKAKCSASQFSGVFAYEHELKDAKQVFGFDFEDSPFLFSQVSADAFEAFCTEQNLSRNWTKAIVGITVKQAQVLTDSCKLASKLCESLKAVTSYFDAGAAALVRTLCAESPAFASAAQVAEMAGRKSVSAASVAQFIPMLDSKAVFKLANFDAALFSQINPDCFASLPDDFDCSLFRFINDKQAAALPRGSPCCYSADIVALKEAKIVVKEKCSAFTIPSSFIFVLVFLPFLL